MKLTLALITMAFAASAFAQTAIDRRLKKNEIYYYCAPCGCEYDGKHFNTPGVCNACNMTFEVSIEGWQERTQSRRRITVGLLLFDGADIMDVTGPWSVFTHAGFDVITFAKSPKEVTIGGNLTIKPDFAIESMPEVSVLVFPGSGLAETNPGDAQIKQFIIDRFEKTEVMLSVCSGAFFFAEAGVLKGLEATTFASMIPMLENYDGIRVLDNVKYTDNGKVVTSGGLSSGIDAAFHVVSKFRGDGITQDIANQMEYPRNLKFDYARSQLADNFITMLRPLMGLLTSNYISSTGDNNQWEFVFELRNDMTSSEALSILDRELRKSATWENVKMDKGHLTGVVTNESLGRGNVVIELD
ncbi:MAG: DJ-1/PfpI family protein, partial [Cyclobacteriaceae bacterium]